VKGASTWLRSVKKFPRKEVRRREANRQRKFKRLHDKKEKPPGRKGPDWKERGLRYRGKETWLRI